MEDIRMTDQKAQYARLKPELDAAFSTVMQHMAFEDGLQVQGFARSLAQLLKVAHASLCATGTDALQLALMALQLPAGAEVIMPAFNDASGAALVAKLGLRPVLADVLPDTFTLDPDAAAKVLTPASAAVVPTHLFGQCADLHALLQLAQAHQLWLIEDNTQAFGAFYSGPDGRQVRSGSVGHLSFTSFFPPKPLAGEGEGGAVCTSDKALAATLLQLPQPDGTGTAKLSTLQAAMLEVKIRHVDAFNQARQEIARFYDQAFAETALVKTAYCAPCSSHIYQQYTIRVPAHMRDGLQRYLRDHHIPSMVYYPQPLHLQDAFSWLGYKPGDFPVAEALCQTVLSLPMHSELKQDQLAYICRHVLDYVKRHG